MITHNKSKIMFKYREGKKAQCKYSSSGPKFGHLPSNRNGKAKKVVASPIGRPTDIIVPSKIGRRVSTHTAKMLATELTSFYQELCHEIRARTITDGIKKPILQHSEKKKMKTKIVGKIVSSDEMSFVSGLTMGSSILGMKSTAIRRTKPPPIPKKKEVIPQTVKAHPPPPPPRCIPSSMNPSRLSVMSDSYLPAQLEIIIKAPAPSSHTLVDSSLVSLSVSDLCPDALSPRQEWDVGMTRSPTLPDNKPCRKSLQKSPPPPPRRKVISMPSLPSSLFSPCQDEITCSGREGYDVTRAMNSSKQDSSSAPSSSGTKYSIQGRRTCGSGESKVVLRDTIRIKSGACRENERVCNSPPLPGRGKEPMPSRRLRQKRKDRDGRDKISLPPVNFCQNSISDRAGNKGNEPLNDYKNVTCVSILTLPLHDKKNIQGKFAKSHSNSTSVSKGKEITPTPSGRYGGTSADGNRITADNMMPSSSRKAKFDKYGRCLQHPLGIMGKKKTSSEGCILLRDECRQCVQECSNDSFNWGEDFIRATRNKIEVAKSKPGSKISIMPTNNRARNLTDVDKREPRIRSNIFGENRTSSQTQVVKSGNSRDRTSKVSTMPYSIPWGKSGWYSGDVNEDVIPHGIGMMRFKNGDKYDGKWIYGYPDMFLANGCRTKRGYSKNCSPRKEAQTKMPGFCHQKPADYHHVKAP